MEYGIVCRKPNTLFSYFGWGSVARIGEHTLIAACSGMRARHVCPWGKSLVFFSYDDGKTWSEPTVVNDTVLDDRDTGIVHLGGNRVALTWFNHPLRYCDIPEPKDAYEQMVHAYLDTVEPMDDQRHGSYIRISEDGGFSWSKPQKMEVAAPHGPCVLNDGSILYFGQVFYSDKYDRDPKAYHNDPRDPKYNDQIKAYASKDGYEWEELGAMPWPPHTQWNQFCEGHAVQLENGRILGMVRFEPSGEALDHYPAHGSMFQTWSDDGGKTWSDPVHTGILGVPPHLIRHSSGAIICSYGRRAEPFGAYAAISYDGGKTWAKQVRLSEANDWDLGYACTTELADGSLYTVYYQHYGDDPSTSFLSTHWSLDEV